MLLSYCVGGARMSGGRMRVEGDTLHLAHHSLTTDNVIGARLLQDENRNSGASLVLEHYPLIAGKRAKQQVVLDFESESEATRVMNDVHKMIKVRPSPHLVSPRPTRRLLALINPFAGQQKAVAMFSTYVSEVLRAADIEVDIKQTERSGHAIEVMRELELQAYDGVLVDSGDGLVAEVLHGLLLRPDRHAAMRFPICHIPGGTSNALAAALCFISNEPFSPRDVFFSECALMAARPRLLPLRLYRVETQHDGVKPMFMTMTWGLIADIDIGSERFRWAGMIRLHMEAVVRCLSLPSVARYRARISYIPVDDKELSRKTVLTSTADRRAFGKGHFDYEEVQPMAETSSRCTGFETMEQALDGEHTVEMPPLGTPLPAGWHSFEGEFAMVCVNSLSHFGSDLPFLPSARLDEDIVYLTLLDWKTIKSRFEVAQLLITMSEGWHLDHKCLQVIPARAVRVEPLGPPQPGSSYQAVDGEVLTAGSAFQVQPTRLCATVMGRKEVVR